MAAERDGPGAGELARLTDRRLCGFSADPDGDPKGRGQKRYTLTGLFCERWLFQGATSSGRTSDHAAQLGVLDAPSRSGPCLVSFGVDVPTTHLALVVGALLEPLDRALDLRLELLELSVDG